jgi:hypothetical protein
LADLDRINEVQVVHRHGYQKTPAVTAGGDRSSDVHQVHDFAAEDVSKTIGIVRKNHLHRFRKGIGYSFRLLVPHASLSLEARITSLRRPHKPCQADSITPLCLPKAWKALSSSVALNILFEPRDGCNLNPRAG